jgi:hypothetical protein
MANKEYLKGDVSMCNQNIKEDDNKARYDLIPIAAIEELAKVLTYGEKKYEANTWQEIEKDRIYAAMLRHIVAWRKGEILDAESKLPHLAHVLANVVFLLEKYLKS